MTPDRMGNRRRDGDGERRSRPPRPARPERGEAAGRSGRTETLERIEQRAAFHPHPPEWGRPELLVGQRVAWNFLYKLANSEATRGTITRVGETCDIRWDDGIETMFMPPLIVRMVQEGEEAGQAEISEEAGPDDAAADEG